LHSGEGVEEFGIGAVGVGEGRLVQEAGGALVAHGEIVAAGGVGEGAGQKGFPYARWAEDEHVEVLSDPFALSQLEDETAVDATGGREVEVFDGGR